EVLRGEVAAAQDGRADRGHEQEQVLDHRLNDRAAAAAAARPDYSAPTGIRSTSTSAFTTRAPDKPHDFSSGRARPASDPRLGAGSARTRGPTARRAAADPPRTAAQAAARSAGAARLQAAGRAHARRCPDPAS